MMSETFSSAAIEMEDANVVAMRDLSRVVLERVNWAVKPGEFWVVGGMQQAGKTDLLMTLDGLMQPASGRCWIFGEDAGLFTEKALALRLRLGFVFDGGQLFGNLTVWENVALPLRYHKNLAVNEAAQVVNALLEMLELTPFADLTPANVAVNWRQRAALARALILKPEVLLLDAPLRGVRGRHTDWWLHFLDQLQRGHEWFGGRPMTIIATTEDLRPWRGAGRQFAILKDKQFTRVGAWSEVEASTDPVIKELLAAPAGATI